MKRRKTGGPGSRGIEFLTGPQPLSYGREHESPGRTGRQVGLHNKRSIQKFRQPLHALVDRQGLHSAALVDAQGVFRPLPHPSGPYRHILQDRGDDRLPRQTCKGMGGYAGRRQEQGSPRSGNKSFTGADGMLYRPQDRGAEEGFGGEEVQRGDCRSSFR